MKIENNNNKQLYMLGINGDACKLEEFNRIDVGACITMTINNEDASFFVLGKEIDKFNNKPIIKLLCQLITM